MTLSLGEASMTTFQLIRHSLFYHARGNAAVLLGTALGAAVLAGAFLVGDSLRGSLQKRAGDQLNGTSHALVGSRFVRQALADELPGGVKPVILLQGSARNGDRLASKLTILGVDARFGLGESTPTTGTVTLSQASAATLQAKVGDRIRISVQKASAIPRSSALAKRDTQSATAAFEVRVGAILPEGDPAAEFTLSPGPSLPLNLMLSLDTLQREIDQEGRVNALLSPEQPLQPLQDDLARRLTLDDWGLKVQVPPKRKAYVSIESRRLILEPAVVNAVARVADRLKCDVAPTFVYLANGIGSNGATIPYSVVAAIDPNDPTSLNPVGESFGDDEIVLVDWRDSPLKVKPGDSVTLDFFKPEVEGKVEDDRATFRLKRIIPLDGAAADPDLVPEFPGITNKLSLRNWDPPFPYDGTRVKDADEKYWRMYKTTPKAYVTLNAARRLWGSRFGDTTSVRLSPRSSTPATALAEIQTELLKELDPAKAGLTFEPIRERLMAAGKGSTDFGMLFVAFSFFLIASALLLVAMLFRLNLERRAKEVGLLRSAGFSIPRLRRLLLTEGLILAAVGSAVGLALAPAYASAMLDLFKSLWPSGSVKGFLKLHVNPLSLIIGFVASLAMSALAIGWAIRSFSRIAPSLLLKGASVDPEDDAKPAKWGWRLAIGSAIAGIALLVMGPAMPPGEPRAGTFFGGGAMFLTCFLAIAWVWMKRPRRQLLTGLTTLGLRNATRIPARGLLTSGLLASAAFLLVAVESFRREPDGDFLKTDGGSGGFTTFAEADSPIYLDLNSTEGRDEILLGIQRDAQRRGVNIAAEQAKATAAFASMTVYPFRVRGGDDASCLNLYQAGRPRILGAADALVNRGGFRFSGTLAKTDEEKTNPWRLLEPKGNLIPGFVEENTAMWQLKKGLGDTIDIIDEEGRTLSVQLVGFFKDSIFQSEIVIGDAAFRKAFPRSEGFSYFLFDADGNEAEVADALSTGLVAYGFSSGSTRSKVASFLAVQNTYLTTFQLLGGFGLLLGAIGLAIVLLRNVFERAGELSLLRAVGYRTATLARLIFIENAALLFIGLVAGVAAAVISVIPHLAAGSTIPVGRLAVMLGGVIVVGLVSSGLAVVWSVRTSVVQGIRRE
jgi:putative ABC transport system permease protein